VGLALGLGVGVEKADGERLAAGTSAPSIPQALRKGNEHYRQSRRGAIRPARTTRTPS
jgi:hypothetical protein